MLSRLDGPGIPALRKQVQAKLGKRGRRAPRTGRAGRERAAFWHGTTEEHVERLRRGWGKKAVYGAEEALASLPGLYAYPGTAERVRPDTEALAAWDTGERRHAPVILRITAVDAAIEMAFDEDDLYRVLRTACARRVWHKKKLAQLRRADLRLSRLPPNASAKQVGVLDRLSREVFSGCGRRTAAGNYYAVRFIPPFRAVVLGGVDEVRLRHPADRTVVVARVLEVRLER